MSERIPCIVPFCGKSGPRGPVPASGWAYPMPGLADEWVCGDHWRLIPLQTRQIWGRYARRWRRYGPPRVVAPLAYNLRMLRAARRVWAALKRQAIERAVGVA